MMNASSDKFVLEVASLPEEMLQAIQRALADMGVEAEEHRVNLKSYDPPAWVELITTPNGWLTLLGAGAGIYISSYIAAAAQEHYTNRKQIRQAVIQRCGDRIQRLRQVVAALRLANSGRRKDVATSISIDDISFSIPSADEEEAIDALARSVHLMEAIKRAVGGIHDRVRDTRIMNKVRVRLTEGGFTLHWVRQDGNVVAAIRRDYDHDGNPLRDEEPDRADN
jgi:hypothetical protein